MQNSLDTFYLQKEEPTRSCLTALRDIILSHNKEIAATLKYGMPCFTYQGKALCYLWVHKKYHQPYILIVEGKHIEHPRLLVENRSRMKIMLFDPEKDLPIRTIRAILKQAISLSRMSTAGKRKQEQKNGK